jgi:hypothetical protein
MHASSKDPCGGIYTHSYFKQNVLGLKAKKVTFYPEYANVM